jgi:hypothetical protein
MRSRGLNDDDNIVSLKAALKAKEAWYANAMQKALQQKENEHQIEMRKVLQRCETKHETKMRHALKQKEVDYGNMLRKALQNEHQAVLKEALRGRDAEHTRNMKKVLKERDQQHKGALATAMKNKREQALIAMREAVKSKESEMQKDVHKARQKEREATTREATLAKQAAKREKELQRVAHAQAKETAAEAERALERKDREFKFKIKRLEDKSRRATFGGSISRTDLRSGSPGVSLDEEVSGWGDDDGDKLPNSPLSMSSVSTSASVRNSGSKGSRTKSLGGRGSPSKVDYYISKVAELEARLKALPKQLEADMTARWKKTMITKEKDHLGKHDVLERKLSRKHQKELKAREQVWKDSYNAVVKRDRENAMALDTAVQAASLQRENFEKEKEARQELHQKLRARWVVVCILRLGGW